MIEECGLPESRRERIERRISFVGNVSKPNLGLIQLRTRSGDEVQTKPRWRRKHGVGTVVRETTFALIGENIYSS